MNVLESFSLKGKVALVTGGAGLYGRQIVEALAEAGADTYIASRNLESLQQVAEEETKRGYKVTALQLDLSKDDSIEKLYNDIIQKSGKCDVLINNAGALWWKSVLDTPVKRYDIINSINSRAAFIATALGK